MFEQLTDKIDVLFKGLTSRGKLNEANVRDALKEVRRALLSADVNFKVAKKFVTNVQEKALGSAVLESITPGQQFIKIVHDEMVELLGRSTPEINLPHKTPANVILVGLQGSGKTTTAGKLAKFFAGRKFKPMLVACDIHRPAAARQLQIVGQNAGFPVLTFEEGETPAHVAHRAQFEARQQGNDLVILDTAGRLQIDEAMMAEAREVIDEVQPDMTLLVLDAMTGQEAVNVGTAFNESLGVDGFVLSKMDGDARGGAALSLREVTGKPLYFIGTGEKLDALERFHPDRMAGRILGMGDVVTLVEKAEFAFDEKKSKELEKKLRKQKFDLDDFREQLKQLRNMGPLEDILSMIPGVKKSMLKGMQIDEKATVHIEAIIDSMTPAERRKPTIIDGSRRKRIAMGSGTSVQEVNRLLKQFFEMQKMFKKMGKGKKMSFPGGFGF
ncbi:MAG TPA: signal recognition particle protein [candidate division Zixibacteria bacterium]|nr:signal recognition particle protein [candidate division Zixibacteria bacterium]